MNDLKSQVTDVQNLADETKKKKRKRLSKQERKRRRMKREAETNGIKLLNNKRKKISCSEESSPNRDCNSLETSSGVKPIRNHNSDNGEQSTNPSATASCNTLSKGVVCSSTTKNPLLSVPVVSSSGMFSSPSPLEVSSPLFGSIPKFESIKNRIEFVYPKSNGQNDSHSELSVKKNNSTGIIPYVHTKLKITAEIKDEDKKVREKSKDGPISTQSIKDEDIDDILYPERKQKRVVEINRKKAEQDKNAKSPSSSLQTCTMIEKHGDEIEQEISTTHSENNPSKETYALEGKETDESTLKDNGNKRQESKKKHETKEKDFNDLAMKIDQTSVILKHEGSIKQGKIQGRKEKPICDNNTEIANNEDNELRKRRLSGLTVEDALKDKVGRRPRCNSTDRELNLPQRGLCDEHMVLESHKWNIQKLYGKNNKSISPRGLINLGNTCFLNATLQCLAHLPTFCQCVAVMSSQNGGKNLSGSLNSLQSGKAKKLGNGQRFTINLRVLLRKMHSLDGGNATNHGPIAPKEIVRSLSQLGGSNRGHKFRPGRQEDAHEFLVHLMDMMHDGELKAAGIDQKKVGWRNSIPIPRLEETTFVHRMFGGYLRSQVECTHCKYRSNTYDPFLDLSLEISANSAKSISTAFAQFMRKETLDVANKWKCSGCKKRVCASKQLTCFRPPLSLCIQLKRFAFSTDASAGYVHHKGGWRCGHFSGKGMGMTRGGSKIQKPIEFPALLKLPLSDGRKCDYELTGIVIHVGGSATSGHYTAYVRRPSSHGARSNWYHMDDSYVKPVSEKTVLKQKDAYILFYCRKEVKLEIPLPPPRSMLNIGKVHMMGEAMARIRTRVDSNLDGELKLDKNMQGERTSGELILEKNALAENRKAEGDTSKEKFMEKSILEKKHNTQLNDANTQAEDPSTSGNSIRGNMSAINIKDKSIYIQGCVVDNAEKSDGSNYENIENITARKSKCHDEDETNKLEDNTSNISIERDPKKHMDNDSLLANSSTHWKNDQSNAELMSKKRKGIRKNKVVSVDIGHRGSVQVILKNPSKRKKKWKPDISSTDALALGNLNANGWEEESCLPDNRRGALEEIILNEKARKRKMYPDKWDAELDRGKTKKVKMKTHTDPFENCEPQNNPFQRMQHKSMQSKNGTKKPHLLKNKKIHSKNKKSFRKL